MKWTKSGIAAMLVAGLVLAASLPALAAGMWGNLPPAGGSQFPTTIPLTGIETIPADTNLTQGLNPATELISTSQLAAYVGSSNVEYNANAATGAVTLTAAEVTGSSMIIVDMTGTLGAGAALTTPTAAQIVAAAPELPVGSVYVVRILNRSAANTWTLTAGTGVTITGTATIAAVTWREFAVTITSATAVNFRNIGAGDP